jgi:hypothetical protein
MAARSGSVVLASGKEALAIAIDELPRGHCRLP